MTTRVLIIDPDITFMVSLKQALEGAGEFIVSVSATGPAAEDSLRRERHDVAVLDFEVPELDVMELIADLRHIQPDLPILMTPHTDLHHERARFLDIQGVLSKPYMARDLIPHLRSLASRTSARPAPGDEFVPPAMPPTLRNLMPPPQADRRSTPSPTELLDDVERSKLGDRAAGLPDNPDAILRELETLEANETRRFDQPDQEADYETKQLGDAPPGPAKTTALLRWDTVPPTTQLADTRELADKPKPAGTVRFTDDYGVAGPEDEADAEDVLSAHGWVIQGAGTRLFEPFLGEPPTQEEDTPTVPPQDLPGVRQFLATDVHEHDPTTFGEVLDAVAQSPPKERPLSPDDAAFNQLVDSMRAPDERRTRRRWLEDLLASIAADTANAGDDTTEAVSDDELDYVLDAIRREQSLDSDAPLSPRTDAGINDPTIGDVMHDLFDPSFEDVLDALAGKEIGDENFAEPTYAIPPTGSGAQPRDRIALDDLADDRDAPEWLRAYEAEGLDSVEMELESEPVAEPPVAAEDSSRYPATAALNAVSQDRPSEDFSLNQLLSQIEQQLPPPRSGRPRLKPLPSWGDASILENARSLESMFDRLESAGGEPRGAEGVSALDDTDALEQLLNLVDAEESEESAMPPDQSHPDAADEPGAMEPADAWQAADDELPEPPGEPEPATSETGDLNALFDAMDAGEEWLQDEASQIELEAELEAGDLDGAIAEAFYAGVHEQADLTFSAPEDETGAVFEEAAEEAPEFALEPGDRPAALSEAEEEAPAWDEIEEIAPIDDEHLIPVPVETAARLLSGEDAALTGEEEDDAALAQIAVQLTQYSLESSAQATMLSQPGKLLAGAGDLPDAAMDRLFDIVDAAWQTRSSDDTDSLMRYITLPDAGDFLLYSKLVAGGLILSMVFNLDTTVSVIRRQARRLSESLDLVPDADETLAGEDAPVAAQTLPSRPTDMRRPEGWRVGEDVRIVDEAGVLQRPGSQEEADMGFTCLWLPRDPGQELGGDFAADLRDWVAEISIERGWRVDAIEVDADFIAVSLCVPQKTPPDDVITHLMDETTHRTAALYPELIDGYQPLWADGYYLVMPPRDLSDREIARFITYQRQAQIG